MKEAYQKYQIVIALCLIVIVLLIGLNIQTSNQLNEIVMEKNKSMFHVKKLEEEKLNLGQEKKDLEDKLQEFEDNQ